MYYIGEFSKLTSLSIDTLRYYEQEDLIHPARDSANRRTYSDSDLKWIDFIKRLKETGMPIKDIKIYSKLRADGDATLTERKEMLEKHRSELRERIITLQQNMTLLEDKIDYYLRAIQRAK